MSKPLHLANAIAQMLSKGGKPAFGKKSTQHSPGSAESDGVSQGPGGDNQKGAPGNQHHSAGEAMEDVDVGTGAGKITGNVHAGDKQGVSTVPGAVHPDGQAGCLHCGNHPYKKSQA